MAISACINIHRLQLRPRCACASLTWLRRRRSTSSLLPRSLSLVTAPSSNSYISSPSSPSRTCSRRRCRRSFRWRLCFSETRFSDDPFPDKLPRLGLRNRVKGFGTPSAEPLRWRSCFFLVSVTSSSNSSSSISTIRSAARSSRLFRARSWSWSSSLSESWSLRECMDAASSS